jgi:hypothetical protein
VPEPKPLFRRPLFLGVSACAGLHLQSLFTYREERATPIRLKIAWGLTEAQIVSLAMIALGIVLRVTLQRPYQPPIPRDIHLDQVSLMTAPSPVPTLVKDFCKAPSAVDLLG